MGTLKDQFDEAARQLALYSERQNAARILGLLQTTVQAFKEEGFDVALEVRPDKIGSTAFSESAGQKFIFNGEVTAEGQRVDFVVIKGYSSMQFKMTWGGEALLYCGSTMNYVKGRAEWSDGAPDIAGAPASRDEYGDDPVRAEPKKKLEDAMREVLINVLACTAAAAQHNVAPGGAPAKSFKVPSTIKLAKDKTP